MNAPPKIELRNIRKTFPGVVALGRVNFAVEKGTVHVLCGENGAGKSTLMKVLNGIYKADEGEILIDGQKVEINNPIEASQHGIAMIFQELNFVPEMTVEENLFLGCEPTIGSGPFKRIDWAKIRRETNKLIEQEKLPYSPTAKLCDLTVSDIQLLEITKAISRNADVIIMDEPTSAITSREVERLLERIGQLKAQGICIVYISHKMEEIFRIADQITVIRDGSVVSSHPAKELNIDKVIALMVGRELTNVYPKEDVPAGSVIFEAKNLNSAGMFRDVSFNVRAGEIVGFAGLVGAGRTEVVEAIFGIRKILGGKVFIEGKEVSAGGPVSSIKRKIAKKPAMMPY